MAWLFSTPLDICVNSLNNDYHIKWKGIGEARIIVLPKDLLFHYKIAFWEKDYSILQFKFNSKKKDKKKDKKKKKTKRNFKKKGILAKRILSSFSIQKLHLNIDTKNYILNGYLFPIFYHLTRISHGKPQLQINYKGKTEVDIHIRNRLINIFYAVIKAF